MSGIWLVPAVSVEFIGSALVIFLAFTALGYARALIKLQPDNFIWGFLWYFSIALAAFAISRGVGHIIRICLVYSDHQELWKTVSPYSGGFNTVLLISVSAVTIYYHRGLAAYKVIRNEAEKLADANLKLATSADDLQELNTNLEVLVEERTHDLSMSEKKFRTFFENSKDIIYFTDLAGNITDINTSGLELLAAKNDQTTINLHQFFADQEVLKQYLYEIEINGYVSDLEVELYNRDGISHSILLSGNGRYGVNGELVGYEGIGKDMTRILTMTEQLVNQEKMATVGKMAAGVAHEINTPLGIILGYSQLMLDDFKKDSEEHETMTVIERQTKVCRRIVADLLKFSRQADSTKNNLNVNEIIREVLAVTEHSLSINKVNINRNFQEPLPQITGDAEKLHQVFINLFNNAQFAMADGGDISITTSSDAHDVSITVSDTGSGIPEEIKNKVFDPFFTTKDVGKGTGLGLSVSYGIIQEHHGSINVESPIVHEKDGSVSQGAAFHITLPISEDTNKEQ